MILLVKNCSSRSKIEFENHMYSKNKKIIHCLTLWLHTTFGIFGCNQNYLSCVIER